MNKTPLENFISRLQELPLDIREGVLAVDFLAALQKIQTQYRLHIDQGALLEELTFRLMLGDITEEQYMKDMQNELHINQDQSNLLANAINENIIEPIKIEIERIERENVLIESVDEQPEAIAETPEYHATLKSEDILAEIEKPTISPTISTKMAPPFETTPLPPPSVPSVVAPIIEPAVAPVAPIAPTPSENIATKLDQTMSAPLSSKPTEIKHSLDPYLEPVN